MAAAFDGAPANPTAKGGNMSSWICQVISLVTIAAFANAQSPAHATHINPNSGSLQFKVLHLDDVVLVLTTSGWSRSEDGGRSWQIVDQVAATFPVVAADGDGDLVAILGSNSTAQGSGPQVSVSNDRGLTWGPTQQVGQFVQSGVNTDFHVVVFGLTICVFWSEPIAGTVSMQRSADGGVTWQNTPTQLGSVPGPAANLMPVDIVAYGTTIHAFWTTRTGAGTLGQHQVSTDGGLTWLPSPQSTPSPPSPGWGSPLAKGSPGLLLIAKIFAGDTNLLQRSTDGGTTWSTVAGLAMPIVVDFAVAGQTVVVVGYDRGFPDTWYVQVSLDGCQTWLTPNFVATAGPGFLATAHIVGPDLYVNFRHQRIPQTSVLAYSGDLGATWRSMASQVNRFAPDPKRNLNFHFVSGGPGVPPVYAYVGLGSTPRGVGTRGTGALVPELGLSRPPILGIATSLELANTVGGTVGIVGLSSAAPAGQPLAGGTLWIQAPVVPILVSTSGAAGVPGGGAASVSVSVPNLPAFAGMILTSQALVIDSQATDRMALSHAIEWYIN